MVDLPAKSAIPSIVTPAVIFLLSDLPGPEHICCLQPTVQHPVQLRSFLTFEGIHAESDIALFSLYGQAVNMLNHLVCDFAETVRWWMKHEQYSAEDVSRFFFAAAPF